MASAPLVRGFGAGAAFAYRKGVRISVERFLADASRLAAALPNRNYLLNLCSDRYHFAVGFAAALLSGLAYALLAEDVRPLLPIVTPGTFWLWVIGAVALAELLKNAVYEPVVLGDAVHLHPLVVVIGVVGGAILFGPFGMLLAIPTMTVVTVFISSTARHLRAYGLI